METDEHPTPERAQGALTADQIEQQGFARARRGLDEQQVRQFLRRVADEHVALTTRLAELEEKLRHPSVPSGQQLVDMVGEEVARTLRSAQESANEVSMRARERAAQMERHAADAAERTRADQIERATQDARAIVEAARERGREMVIEARALRERVISDLNRRRETLRNYIEQLHADRDRLTATYRVVRETVRDAQDKLARFEGERPFDPVPIDAGPAPVLPPPPQREPARRPEPARARQDFSRRTPAPRNVAPATGIGLGELSAPPEQPEREPQREPEPEPEPQPKSQREPPAATQEPAPEPPAATHEPEPEPAASQEPEPEPEPAAPEPEPEWDASEPEPDAPEPEPAAEREPEPVATMQELELESPGAVPDPGAAAPEPDADSEPALTGTADVEGLFQRIRAGGAQREPFAAAVGDAQEQRGKSVVVPWSADASTPAQDLEGELQRARTVAADGELLAKRDEVLTSLAHDLVRRCKRVLQNEQNEVLDALRRQRGRLTADKLLPPAQEQLSAWTEAMAPAIDEAYVAARAAAASSEASPVFSAPRRIVTAMVGVVVTPLRERLLAAVDETVADDPHPDTSVLAQRLGSRYREWKGQELDSRIGDVLAAAYARGVYDAAPEGSRLRWLPAEPGRCPDADDNALEPTTRGEQFPTGQQFPPAHPGCRCLLVVVDHGRGSA
jgi:DivIVA domain-containing protein